jgi:hypothetical protein
MVDAKKYSFSDHRGQRNILNIKIIIYMTIEDKVKEYKELIRRIEELEEQKRGISAEILQLMPYETRSLQVGEYIVRSHNRLSIKISLHNAKNLGAVKLQEVVDKEKIKELFETGLPIPDVKPIQFISVSKISNKCDSREATCVGSGSLD